MADKLSRKQAAAYLNRKPRTLTMWAMRARFKLKNSERYDIPHYMVGGRAEYRKDDLDAFLVRYPSR